MKKILSLLLLILFAIPHISTAQTAKINRLKKEKGTLQKQISDSEALLKTTRKDVKSQLGNLMLINAQIGEQQKYVDGIQTEIIELSNNIGVLKKELAILEKDLEDCKHKYKRAVMFMFRNKMTHSKWTFVLSAKNFKQMKRRLRYASQYGKYQQLQGEIIKTKEKAVEAKRDEILQVKKNKDDLLVSGQKQQHILNNKKEEQKKVINELNQKQTQLQAQIADKKRKAAALNSQIDRLIQIQIAAAEKRRKEKEAKERAEREKAAREEAARRKQEQMAAKAKTKGSKSSIKENLKTKTNNAAPIQANTPKWNEESNTDRALSGSFEANRGRLAMPITGPYAITAHFGTYNVNGLKNVQLDNKGINITGKAGAQARCIYKGTVTAIFTLGGLYNIIVRHGQYMSVYCNLSSVSVRNGQEVSSHQILGSVANDGTGNCTLHFQLRKQTSKLNPESWLGR